MRKARIVLAHPKRPVREQIAGLLEALLPSEIHAPPTGPDAQQAALEVLPDLVVAAQDLPGLDGLRLTHMLRGVAQLQDTPIVILGPRGDQQAKYQAFYVGATEYVEEPFDPLELQYRLRVQLRGLLRARDAAEAIACGPLTLEPATRTARLGGRQAVLTPAEFSLLRYFAAHPGRPLSAQQLLTEALGHPAMLGNPQLVHTHMRNLRKKLEADPAHPELLQRHPAGYMLALPPGR